MTASLAGLYEFCGVQSCTHPLPARRRRKVREICCSLGLITNQFYRPQAHPRRCKGGGERRCTPVQLAHHNMLVSDLTITPHSPPPSPPCRFWTCSTWPPRASEEAVQANLMQYMYININSHFCIIKFIREPQLRWIVVVNPYVPYAWDEKPCSEPVWSTQLRVLASRTCQTYCLSSLSAIQLTNFLIWASIGYLGYRR